MLSKLIYKLKLLIGYQYCPSCSKFTYLKFTKIPIYHPEEPPMFGTWECKHCKWNSGILPTYITEDAAKKLGYKDIIDYCEKNGMS